MTPVPNSHTQKLIIATVIFIACSNQSQAESNAQSSGDAAIEEVVVTAQRRSESAVDVPISVTAIGAEQLGQGDVQQLSDIMKLTPGLRFDFLGGNAQPTIRGVGSSVVVAGAGANVALYTDGFYSPNPLVADTELLNVNSVQVLKGPQGTLFGRNSTGGAVLVTTSEPSSELGADLRVSYSSFNTQRYQAYLTGGPSESLAFDIAALHRTSDGYLDNITTGADDDGQYENNALRLGMRWDISDRLSALFRYTHAKADDPSVIAVNAYEGNGQIYSTAASFYESGAFPGIPQPYTTEPYKVASNYKPGYTAESDAFQLTLEVDLDFATLTSYTQYRDETATHYYDFDFSALDIYHYIFTTTDEIFTQEFLLSSNSNGPLQWTTGLFYFSDETDYPNNLESAAGAAFTRTGGSGVTAESIAVFIDTTYAILDDLFLTLGVRYSKDKQTDAYYFDDATQQNVAVPGLDYDEVTPRAALRYELDDESSVYISYAEGFKSGILNIAGDTSGDITVDPENIKAYEIGHKHGSDSLVVETALFYYDYENLQIATYEGTLTIIKNAADSTINGLDMQMRYAVTDNFSFNVGATFLDAEYDTFTESQPYVQCTDFVACGNAYLLYAAVDDDASGNQMSRSPDFTATLGANYQIYLDKGTLDLSGTLYHTSSFYFDSSNVFKQEAYDLLSASVAWTDPSERYTVGLFADNLLDEEYHTQVLPQFAGTLATWGTPRTVGVSLDVSM